jgi:predicted N-formylglutamate amidohydrolase
MTSNDDRGLLTSRDAQPVAVTNREGAGLFLLLGDHAGNRVPERLDGLGLPPGELDRHIGWDIGVAALGRLLSASLDAPFIEQSYSRLVIDCNRAVDNPDCIAAVSDGTAIPGNIGIAAADRRRRVDEIYRPYHDAIAALLAERDGRGQRSVVVALHSFTPVMQGIARPWQLGVLHGGGDAWFARAVLAELGAEPEWTTGDNQPYRMDATDFTVPEHAFAARRPYVELEVRQDEIAGEAGQARIAALLVRVLCRAASAISVQ